LQQSATVAQVSPATEQHWLFDVQPRGAQQSWYDTHVAP
jgi:hypothetical protein